MTRLEIDSQNQKSEKTEFEGEETLGAEYNDTLDSPNPSEENTTDIYPDALVNIAPEVFSVFQLKRKFDKTPPLIKLDPDFQRYSLWSSKQKSELIESILMGIPLPLIYVKEDAMGVYIIVDGRQRLTTLFQFLNHDFPLQKLNVLKNLNGFYFSQLSKDGISFDNHLTQLQQSKIEDCQLTLHVIKPPTKDRVTFDLFDRVNRGGTRLNNQEMRNAIYQGHSTDLLNKLVSLDSFKNATEKTIKSKRMKDKYLVLRLIGFYLWRKKKLISLKDSDLPLVEYRSDLEDFLGKTMLFLNSQQGVWFCKSFPDIFDHAMKTCTEILESGCFRLPKKGDGPRRPISMSLFEAVTYLVIEFLAGQNLSKDKLRTAYRNLIENDKFIESTTYIVDSNKSVNQRFELVESAIKEINRD